MTIIVSYAPTREDRELAESFRDFSEGSSVDVGANHPEEDSVTKFFYNKGWHGINIEPSKDLFIELSKERPRDTNLNIGVSDKPGTLVFREYKNHGLSTFSVAMQKDYLEARQDETGGLKEYSVKESTLEDIFNTHKVKHIHFLKIDVEGVEYDVLFGNKWSLYRTEVI